MVHDVPANVTVVGAPARVVRERRDHGAIAADGDASGRDGRLLAHMRQAVVEYRLKRQSLKSLVDTLTGSFEIGSEGLRAREAAVREDLQFLDAVAATGGEETQQVRAAVDAVEAGLRGG